MELDIDRLHDVIEGKRGERGAGKTTAMMVQVAQSAEVQTFIRPADFAVITGENSLGYTIDRFMEVAAALGIKVRLNRMKPSAIIEEGMFDVEVYFVKRANIGPRLAGKRLLNYYIDHYMVYQLTPSEHNFLESRLERT